MWNEQLLAAQNCVHVADAVGGEVDKTRFDWSNEKSQKKKKSERELGRQKEEEVEPAKSSGDWTQNWLCI